VAAAADLAEAAALDLAEHSHPHPVTDSTRSPKMFFRNVIGAGMIAGAMLAGTAATAAADPLNCTAGDLANINSGVSANTAIYLFSHPDVNDFFTSLKGKSRDQIRDAVTAYLDANPGVKEDLKVARQAAADFRDRCDAPLADMPLGG
jgi:hemophore-related protein